MLRIASQYPEDYFIFHFLPSFLESGSPSGFLLQPSHSFLRNKLTEMTTRTKHVEEAVTIITAVAIWQFHRACYINIISARLERVTIKSKHNKNETSSILSCSATRLTVKGDLFIFLLHFFWVLTLFSNFCDQSNLVCCASWTLRLNQQAHATGERHTLKHLHFFVEKYDFQATGFLSVDIKEGVVETARDRRDRRWTNRVSFSQRLLHNSLRAAHIKLWAYKNSWIVLTTTLYMCLQVPANSECLPRTYETPFRNRTWRKRYPLGETIK